MDYEQKDWKTKLKENKVIVLGGALIVILIVAIGISLYMQLPTDSQFTNNMGGKLSVLQDSDREHVQEIVRQYLGDIYGYSNNEASRVKITIREDSFQTMDLEDGLKYVTFLIDLNHPKVTYSVALVAGEGIDEVTVMCPKYEELQDKSVFCVGYDGDSTLDEIFGDQLPYQNIPMSEDEKETSANEPVPGYEDMLIMIRQIIEEDGVPVLSANVGACEKGPDGDAAREFINNWIKTKGNIDPSLVPLRIKYVPCSGGNID